MTKQEIEERVARIIDWDAWQFLDHCKSHDFGTVEAHRGTRSSIRKARMIIKFLEEQKS